ncbi:MAG: VWA domain-containing protein [Planctomycetes bacterium]|nr:VWA domain-containing protein [Planctomycetota bacterium]
MNWINTLSPWQWLILGAIPPAILSLYFLKLRRRDIVVPSTMLWKRAIEDLHVNSIWQRLRNNLLLILQLLFMALVILACLRPGWSGMNRIGERRIYIIDNSASMGATDADPNRLEIAKAKVRELIEDTSSDDVGMLIAFSDRADVRQGFTSDKRRLLDAVASIQVTSHTTDAREALRAAAGLANPGRVSFEDNKDVQVADAVPATVYLVTDGAIGDLGDADYGQLKIEYLPVGVADTENVGIVGFAVERNEEQPDRLEAFARVANTGREAVECTTSLYLDDVLLDAGTLSVNGGEEAGLRFEMQGIERGKLRLELDHNDALSVDNVAYAAIRPSRQMSILLVTGGNAALEAALKTSRVRQIADVTVENSAFLTSPEYATASAESKYDLIIFDGCTPTKMPESSTLFIGSLPPDDIQASSIQGDTQGEESKTAVSKWHFGPPVSPALILDVNRLNPITQYLEMASVNIVEARAVTPPENGLVLMTSDSGPVFSLAPRGPYQDAILGFDIVRAGPNGLEMNTDWGIKRSFPVFVYGAVEYLGGGTTQASAQSVRPGLPINLTLSSRSPTYEIVDPKGERTKIDRGPDGRFIFTQTDIPGTYEVLAPGLEYPVEMFCSNLFSPSESNLAIGTEIQTSAEKIKATDITIRARQETWRWLLMIGLVLLMIEWVVFNKRVFI